MIRTTTDTIRDNLSGVEVRGITLPSSESDFMNTISVLCEAVNILNARTQELQERVKQLETLYNQEV